MVANALEKTSIAVGVMPLADAAPMIVAQAKGYFAAEGLDVEITYERAWAAIRDKLAAERLDAAQMLAPMPLAATMGIDATPTPMVTSLTLNLNGNAIVVSNALFERLAPYREGDGAIGWAQALRRLIEADRANGRAPLVFAHVYPFSTHHYELRYWLAAAGIRPDHDLNLIVVPPPQAVDQLAAGRIDGFCVGAPWGQVAERTGVGRRLVSKYQIWNNSPEKVLGVTRAWADSYPNTHLALVKALLAAGRWLDQAENRAEAARLMHDSGLIDADEASLSASLAAQPVDGPFGPGLIFHRGAAGFPWVSQAQWFVEQMQRWQQAPPSVDAAKVAAAVFLPALYRRAAAALGISAPLNDGKAEGLHAEAWPLAGSLSEIVMGADRFLDGAHYEGATRV